MTFALYSREAPESEHNVSGIFPRTGQHPTAGPAMPNTLTSWKEIGQYLGKGVRTVQRWEREAGLPVRRLTGGSRRAVIAIPEELDAWTLAATNSNCAIEFEAIRREIAGLRSENAELKARLERVESTRTPLFVIDDVGGGPVWLRDKLAAGSQNRANSVRARIGFAITLCSLSENGFEFAGVALLERAQRSADIIRNSLEWPGYVPSSQLEELRGMLLALEFRIEHIAQGANGANGSRAGRAASPRNSALVSWPSPRSQYPESEPSARSD